MSTASRVTLAHVALGANAASGAFCGNSADLSRSGGAGSPVCSAAFGADAAVALLDAHLRIVHTLRADGARVTGVFLHADGSDGDERVLAGDAAGGVFLWDWRRAAATWQRQRLAQVTTASVAAVAAVATRRRWIYAASFSDGAITVFEQVETETVRLLATLQLGVRCIMETLAATTICAQQEAEESVLLAAGGVDSKVHLYEVAGGASSVQPLLVLEGHRGWIRGLAFERQQQQQQPPRAGDASHSLLLASASQDQRIRLWKITAEPHSSPSSSDNPTAASPTRETRDGFQAPGAHCSYTASFDALLVGHEDWVTSVQWTFVPHVTSDSTSASSLDSALVSSSMDNALVVWRKQAQHGAWSPSLRVGEIHGNGLLKGAVLPSASGRLDLLALNFSGQLERWTQQPAPSKTFLPSLSPTGHCAAVTDLSWSPRGDYVLSVSLDQTARVLAPSQQRGSWHEISRAQVHGYDLNCACFLLGSSSSSDDAARTNDRFVSGADEKILRVFEAPDALQRLVARLSGREELSAVDGSSSSSNDAQQPRVEHAYLPELSLTNKSAGGSSVESSASGYAPIDPDSPASIRVPVGETLGKKTLWPELRKLYGHGNELLCVASNHSGSLVASACKSREERFASVWLWNSSDWSAAQSPLEGHKSSVVQLAFAPNDAFLVSVSRDRQFCVYEKTGGQFALAARVKAHKRIIWSCSWSPDSRFFATASRDQSFALWGRTHGDGAAKWGAVGKPTLLDSAVTAVAFAPVVLTPPDSYVVAVGLESGAIKLFRVSAAVEPVETSLLAEFDTEVSPTATVTRLAWSPCVAPTDEDGSRRSAVVLAASSSDFSVRLYTVELSTQ